MGVPRVPPHEYSVHSCSYPEYRVRAQGSSYCCIYDKIFAKVAAGIGFDRVRIMVTGGA